MKKIAFIAAALLSTGLAQAQNSPFYVDAGYSFMQLKTSNPDTKKGLGALRGMAGWEVHPNLALELMVATGVSEAKYSDGSKIKLTHSLGAFAKPKFAITDQIEVFGRAGWVRTNLKVSDGTAHESQHDQDLAWGLGASYKIMPGWSASLDYTRYYNKNSGSISGIGVNVGYRF
jgi:opacity protein-like surface antigen